MKQKKKNLEGVSKKKTIRKFHREYINPLSFVDFHNPTKDELKEYLENISSFDKHGHVKFRVIVNNLGNPIPVMDFMKLNATILMALGRRLNPSETLITVQHNNVQDWKRTTPEFKDYLKKVRKRCNEQMIREGKNPKIWVHYTTVLT